MLKHIAPSAKKAARKRAGVAGRSVANLAVVGVPYHHGGVPDAMLGAAQRLLEIEGMSGLTLRAAARAAGVSHAAPKNHFGDLTGLLSELAAVGFREFAEALDAAASMPADTPSLRFAAIGAAYVRFAQARPALFLLMFRGERLDMQRPALRDAVEQARQALAGSAAQQMGTEPAPPQAPIGPEQSARMVAAWSLVHGYAMLLIDGRLDPVLARWPAGTDWQVLLERVLGDTSFGGS